ncbi:unnamed protein product, partial [Polarella glacialis]
VLPRIRDSDPAFANAFVDVLQRLRKDVLRFIPDGDASHAAAAAKPALVGSCESWQIPRRHAETLSLAEFRRDFVRSGRPLIIEGLGPHLVSKQSCGLSRDFLSAHFGEKQVAVYRNFQDARLRKAGDEDEADLMRLSEALGELRKGGSSAEGLYLYDLSLPLQLPGLLEHIRLPRYFTHCYLQQTMRPNYKS